MTVPAPLISELLAAIDAANADIRAALADGRAEELPALVALIEQLERRRNAELRMLAPRPAPDIDYGRGTSLRVRVASALHLAGRPVPARLAAEIAEARFGYIIDPRALASMRRDELRSWRSSVENPERPGTKLELVVPALSYDRYTPVRGVLALSSWDLSTRVMAPASGRVDVLRVACNLADYWIDAPKAPWAPKVERIVAQIGRSLVPFAGRNSWPNPTEIAAAALDELAVIEPPDQTERRDAVARATQQLTDEQLLFGVTVVGAINSAARRVS